MDTTQIQEKLNGKSFNSDLNEITPAAARIPSRGIK